MKVENMRESTSLVILVVVWGFFNLSLFILHEKNLPINVQLADSQYFIVLTDFIFFEPRRWYLREYYSDLGWIQDVRVINYI